MLVDPVTVAAAAPTPALVLAITKSDGYGSERVDTGGNGYVVVTNHTTGKAGNRHYLKISKSVDAVNPYSGLTQQKVATASISIGRPDFGFTDADMIALTKAITDYLFDAEVTTARILQFQS